MKTFIKSTEIAGRVADQMAGCVDNRWTAITFTDGTYTAVHTDNDRYNESSVTQSNEPMEVEAWMAFYNDDRARLQIFTEAEVDAHYKAKRAKAEDSRRVYDLELLRQLKAKYEPEG